MRINRLTLTDLRRHESLEIEPAAGLTIIRGPNEAGKSTIAQALEAVLFLKAESEAQAVRRLRRWGSTSPPMISLDFEADGVEGHLRKTFAGNRGSAELLVGAEHVTDPSAIQQRIHELTGIPSAAFYRSTASVGHAELVAVTPDEPLIADRLQKAISGADRGTAASKKKLAAVIGRYRSEGNVNPGHLKITREEAARLEKELGAGERALAALEADRSAWSTARDRRAELDARLEVEKDALAAAERVATIVDRRDKAQARYERDRRATELAVREAELKRLLPTTIPVPELRELVAEAEEVELDVSELQAQIDVSPEVPSELADQRGPRPWRWVAATVVALAIGAVAWLLLGGVLGVVALLVAIVLAVVFAGGAVRAAFRARQFELSQQLAHRDAEERQRTDREAQDEHRRKRGQLERRLEEIGVADAAAAAALLAAAEQHAGEAAAVDGELRGLGVEERDPRALQVSRDQAANEADQARHALAAIDDVPADPSADVRRLATQIERLEPERDAARSEEDQALGRVESNAVDAESVAILDERLTATRERLITLQRRLRVYEATLAAIEAAELATLKTAARYLEEQMGPVIERITEGRYSSIVVNEADLAFTVGSTESPTMVGAEELSRGTADQLYLAARLGLVRLVTMDRRPPIILDDPFVTFDPDRARRAISILRETAAAQGIQVLLLTWSDRFDSEADAVIQLDAPAVPPPPAVGEPTFDVPLPLESPSPAGSLRKPVVTAPAEPEWPDEPPPMPRSNEPAPAPVDEGAFERGSLWDRLTDEGSEGRR